MSHRITMASGGSHGYNTRLQKKLLGVVAQSIDGVVNLHFNRSSSSNLSKCESISDLPCFINDNDTDRRGMKVSYYSLIDIATSLGVDHVAVCNEVKKCGQKQVNDKIACACVKIICRPQLESGV